MGTLEIEVESMCKSRTFYQRKSAVALFILRLIMDVLKIFLSNLITFLRTSKIFRNYALNSLVSRNLI